jgi:uncharacterized circularly permuted ATP-grasp superfamily protein/uncharacterized alpha-E superfamily protein
MSTPPSRSTQAQSQSQGEGRAADASQASLPLHFGHDPGAEAAHLLLSHAHPAEAGVWDELRQPSGVLRPPWLGFARHLSTPLHSERPTDMNRRVAQVARQILQDGVTHNVFSDAAPGGVAARPWSLELLPNLIEAADWAVIEAGAIQRAELLQTMLADFYGPQHLLREGLLPPALLYRHSGWLRPMRGAEPPGGMRLFIVAFDIARGPDGRWWLVAQRTQGPSGLGYVMHNRLLISRQFPDAFREQRVQHIASSYRRLLDTLETLAAQVAGNSTPRVVLLTPGRFSETYFEHAYLARYLGLPLVEGGDLTVRKDRLYLKTVEGLEPVHGLLRRLDDDFCDPLELRPDSALGVPGLLQAARAGSVVVANALGSAFLESPAVQGFMPGIARRMGQDHLLLPALPTWWCGEASALRNVRGELDGKFLRSTFPRHGRTSQVHDLSRLERLGAIDSDPDAWTVQARLRFSRAPIWGDTGVATRPAMVRIYAIADSGGRWHVLPGGMTRVAQREDSSVSMQRGGSSLDTWVLTDGPVDTFSMLPQRLCVDDIAGRRRPVSSRNGENLFWLGRYTERTEQAVQLARATLLLIDADSDATPAMLQALSALATTSGLVAPGTPALERAPHHFERSLLGALADTEGQRGAASIGYNLAALERASQALRERLSSEHWGLIREMGESFRQALESPAGELPTLPQVLPALDRLALRLAAVTGAQSDRMTRDHGWRLLTVGRLLERLIGLTARMRAFLKAGALGSAAGTDLMLELFDSVITFRARYQRHEDLLALTDLLVLDSANPRSLAGVVRRLRTEIAKLPGDAASLAPLLARLPAEGTGLTLDSLREVEDERLPQTLDALATSLSASAMTLADDIASRYFTLAHGLDQRI